MCIRDRSGTINAITQRGERARSFSESTGTSACSTGVCAKSSTNSTKSEHNVVDNDNLRKTTTGVVALASQRENLALAIDAYVSTRAIRRNGAWNNRYDALAKSILVGGALCTGTVIAKASATVLESHWVTIPGTVALATITTRVAARWLLASGAWTGSERILTNVSRSSSSDTQWWTRADVEVIRAVCSCYAALRQRRGNKAQRKQIKQRLHV